MLINKIWDKLRIVFSFKDILPAENWKIISEIKKGWSNDKKYYIETKDNEKLLLRASYIKFYKNKSLRLISKALYFGKNIQKYKNRLLASYQ